MATKSHRRSYLRLSKKSILRVQPLAYMENPEEEVSAYQEVGGGGLRFMSRTAHDIGTLLRIEAEVPGWYQDLGGHGSAGEPGARHLVAVAEVVRVERGRNGRRPIAVRFENVYESDRRALLAYLKRMVENNGD